MTAPNCRNDCELPQRFPIQLFNRPGLSHIDYRIGTYTDIRDWLLHSLDIEPMLLHWTHRTPDDPGIALLEGAAILGDILTFYQELYANEAYLRTARWRESIADLVKLLGYRLAPGVGGRGSFAFELNGTKPVVVPAGFPISAQLAGAATPDDFQTSADLNAFPHLSRFRLYRPRNAPQIIVAGLDQRQLEIQAVGGATDGDSIAALEIEAGDRILLAPDSTQFDEPITGFTQSLIKKTEILVVEKVERVLDRRIVTFEGALTETRATTVTAYKLGRSFRHFGATAPAFTTKFDNTSHLVTQDATRITREIASTDSSADTNYYSSIAPNDMPLDREVNDLASGGVLVCEVDSTFPLGVTHITVARRIAAVRATTMVWGNLTGASTVVTVEDPIVRNNFSNSFSPVDIRTMVFHETKGSAFTLRAPTTWPSGDFTDTTVSAYGTLEEVVALAGRSLLLAGDDGSVQSVSVNTEPDDISVDGRDSVHRWMWPVKLDRLPDPFVRDDFDEATPRVTVFGNIVEATQGKRQRDVILGNGDARESFQTFKIPKAPLTYLSVAGATPPETPELEIWVSERRWTRVASLFGRGDKETVYVVREDAGGDSWVQFGDGKTGARLPSGLNNVVASWRIGVNAHGLLKESTTPQADGKLERLDKIRLPGLVAGGASAETGGHARLTAPGRVQSLGRLVSLRDYETETMTIAGVALASARWAIVDNIPAVVLTLLMQSGRDAEIESVRQSVSTANRCRGPRRFPVVAVQGYRRWVYLAASVTLDPSWPADKVLGAIANALMHDADGDDDETPPGLFSLLARSFGEPEYATRIEGVIQQVPGVVWTAVTGFGVLASGSDPSLLDAPAVPWPRSEVVAPSAEEVLALDALHLALLPAAAITETCT